MTKIADSIKDILWPGGGVLDKPVYLQETGEKLGHIVDRTYDEDGNIAAYTVEADGEEFTFSSENILEGDMGFIYKPLWLTESEKIIDKLETQQRINPEITAKTSTTIDRNRLNSIFARSNPGLEKTVEDAKEIGQLLLEKEENLKNKKRSLEKEIEENTRERMSGENKRKEFAENIVSLKRKVKIIEENLNKLDNLLSRLRDSPLIDFEELKTNVEEDMAYKNEGSIMEKQKSNPDSNRNKEDRSAEKRKEEGERIKKIRIPKLEQEFEQKEARIQEAYLSDLQERIQKVNEDIKELRELSEESEADEQVNSFIEKKIENLKEEKKDLKDKIEEVKEEKKSLQEPSSEAKPQDPNKDIEDMIENKNRSRQEDRSTGTGAMLARMGSLALIIGLIVLLVLSLLRVF